MVGLGWQGTHGKYVVTPTFTSPAMHTYPRVKGVQLGGQGGNSVVGWGMLSPQNGGKRTCMCIVKPAMQNSLCRIWVYVISTAAIKSIVLHPFFLYSGIAFDR